jgi:SAM-dependent MidA family methyltransferase
MTRREFPSILPQLSQPQVVHMQRVTAVVRQAIEAAGGWLAFDDYLRIVQHAPGLGYYSAGSAKFGREGDFVTAPELSPLFGGCLARQCAQILGEVGGDLLELGAGSGALAERLLRGLDQLGTLPAHYYILEISADLRARQRQRLQGLPAELAGRVEWLDQLPVAPLQGVLVANEVADALPFKRFCLRSGAIHERGVSCPDSATLTDADRAADPAFAAEVRRLLQDPMSQQDDLSEQGYLSELCPWLTPWIASLSQVLACGALLLIDYGLPRREYYHPQRRHGTLRCYFRHRAHDNALEYPGLQDISAWVDFTRAAEAASASGLTVSGYCTQAAFLLATGIEQDLAAVSAPLEHARLAAQARTLLLPGEMGESFKVMALTRHFDTPLRGFAYQDLRASL